jgi:tRNA(Ile)-lysidine synthase
VWPQGRSLFLLRPLLGQRRADIRAALGADGFSWIDDPANDDLRHPRVRVRQSGPAPVAPRAEVECPEPLSADGLSFRRDDLNLHALAAAAVCAGGGEHLPGAAQVQRLLRRIRAGEDFVATLCGARIGVGGTVKLHREIGRTPPPTLALPPGRPVVWDGRYELIADRPGLTVGPMAGHAATLSKAGHEALRRMEAWARPGLPLVQGIDQTPFCPVFAGDNGVRARWLVTGRYRAACDLITDERAACDDSCMANGVLASYVWA